MSSKRSSPTPWEIPNTIPTAGQTMLAGKSYCHFLHRRKTRCSPEIDIDCARLYLEYLTMRWYATIISSPCL